MLTLETLYFITRVFSLHWVLSCTVHMYICIYIVTKTHICSRLVLLLWMGFAKNHFYCNRQKSTRKRNHLTFFYIDIIKICYFSFYVIIIKVIDWYFHYKIINDEVINKKYRWNKCPSYNKTLYLQLSFPLHL
jgi:hypothetical protein